MIELRRMGTNMLRRLLRAGHQCDVYDIHPEAVQAVEAAVTQGWFEYVACGDAVIAVDRFSAL